MTRLLSIDWDFFFRDQPEKKSQWTDYDWGHGEFPLFVDPLVWECRALSFTTNGLSLPMTAGFESFWSQFQFSGDSKLIVAESHSRAVASVVSEGVSDVWNYDAHHDGGYNPKPPDECRDGIWTCEDWMIYYGLNGALLHVRYPQWKSRAFVLEGQPLFAHIDIGFHVSEEVRDLTFNRIFVCRSGAWVPPWCDQDFCRFIDACPIPVCMVLDDVSPRKGSFSTFQINNSDPEIQS